MPIPFKVKAVYEYKSDEADDLNFENGQIITVTEEEDDGWYTGEYTNASGQKLEGIFPRNFVEKYEPAIPNRPNRASRKSLAVEPVEGLSTEAKPDPPPVTQPTSEPVVESPAVVEPVAAEAPVQRKSSTTSNPRTETKPPGPKQPPAVAEKPTSSSFKDRIAAFNKPAAAPITPFKPPGGSGSSGFIKKPFVAPPPSRNAYIPPPSQAPPPHIAYRRDEDPDMQEDEEEIQPANKATDVEDDSQPKPTSLKDRIALLQQQQLEQAQRLADKRKSKKPPTKRAESADTLDGATVESTGAPISRRDTGETLGRSSIEVSRIDEEDSHDAAEPLKTEPVVATPIPPPSRELVSDTNDADDSEPADTEDIRDMSEDEDLKEPQELPSPRQPVVETTTEAVEEQGQEDTEDEDPEVRRRRELRDRMAKMSGGMGMMGMFGPPGGAPAPARKSKSTKESDRSPDAQIQDDVARAPPVPVMALPGMGAPKQLKPDSDEEGDDETAAPTPMESRRKVSSDDYITQPIRSSHDQGLPQSPPARSVPPVPRAAPSVPQEPQSSISRAVPPPPPRPAEDDPEDDQDEPATAPAIPSRASLDRRSSTKTSATTGVPPIPSARPSLDGTLPEATTAPNSDKRASRPPPPPVPGGRPVSPTSRAPPPPPPAQPPSRSATSGSIGLAASELPGDGSEEEVTEYEGDYDTDIASSAKHKAALKSHNRDSSIEDDALTDDAKLPANPPPRAVPPPPPPPGAPPREAIPPAPVPDTKSKRSSEVPRAAPPPVPTSRPDDDEHDPYRYSTSQQIPTSPPTSPPLPPPTRSSTQGTEDSDLYGPPAPPRTSRAPPPLPPSSGLPALPTERSAPLPPPPTDQSKVALEAPRLSTSRRSVEMPRTSADYGFIATDVDLAESSGWWIHENTIPSSLQGRNDILYEVESNSTSKRGGRTTVTRDIYVLYLDYSQSTINVSFDPSDPSHASFQQSHERPPPPPRQDQLESASEQFGVNIANAAQSMSGNTVADGSAHAFVLELLKPFRSTALMPVGTRSYGALVYANLANASTQQFDEIRAGDVVTFRNAKFAGHKGGLHAKYSMDVGKPDHVGIVIDWDGTKKKIRAWEQGREDKGKKTKVREESFRIGDLKSGEVRVWRVMPRSWVNWEKS